MKRVWVAAASAVVCVYLALGFYEVEPEEEAVAFVFGRLVASQIAPGIHWNLPPPAGRQVVMATRLSFVQPIGYDDTAVLRYRVSEQEDIWITGGMSVVVARLDIQYSIARLDQFLLSYSDPENYMRLAAERELARFLAGNHVDDVLTAKRQLLRTEVRQALQRALDDANAGIQIQDVAIRNLAPPVAGSVADAFQKVQSARSDRDRAIETARSQASRIVFDARAQAESARSKGQSFLFTRVRKAQGDIERFNALAKEHTAAPRLTERRIYHDTLAEVMRKARLYVVPDSSDNAASISLQE